MIKINLLKSRAVLSSSQAPAGANDSSLNVESQFKLDSGFDTFEYSLWGQLLKLLLIVGFVGPFLVLERMREQGNNTVLNEKSMEVQSIQEIKFQKEEAVNSVSGLEEKKDILKRRDFELKAVRAKRLLGVASIDALQSAMPEDVWLTDVNFETDFLQINGETLVDSGLDIFVENLRKMEGFSNVNVLKDVKVKSESGRTLNEFLITLNVLEGVKTEGVGL